MGGSRDNVPSYKRSNAAIYSPKVTGANGQIAARPMHQIVHKRVHAGVQAQNVLRMMVYDLSALVSRTYLLVLSSACAHRPLESLDILAYRGLCHQQFLRRTGKIPPLPP